MQNDQNFLKILRQAAYPSPALDPCHQSLRFAEVAGTPGIKMDGKWMVHGYIYICIYMYMHLFIYIYIWTTPQIRMKIRIGWIYFDLSPFGPRYTDICRQTNFGGGHALWLCEHDQEKSEFLTGLFRRFSQYQILIWQAPAGPCVWNFEIQIQVCTYIPLSIKDTVLRR